MRGNFFHVLKIQGIRYTTTGAGDAFFGGLVSGIYKWGLPTTEEEMGRLARVASAHGEFPAACVSVSKHHLTNTHSPDALVGAACCEVLGALPVDGSVQRMIELEPELAGF